MPFKFEKLEVWQLAVDYIMRFLSIKYIVAPRHWPLSYTGLTQLHVAAAVVLRQMRRRQCNCRANCVSPVTYTARGYKLRFLLLQARVRAGVYPDRPRGRGR